MRVVHIKWTFRRYRKIVIIGSKNLNAAPSNTEPFIRLENKDGRFSDAR